MSDMERMPGRKRLQEFMRVIWQRPVEYAVPSMLNILLFFNPSSLISYMPFRRQKKTCWQGWPHKEGSLVRPYTDDVRKKILRNISEEQKSFPFTFHDLSGIFSNSTDAVFTDVHTCERCI